MYVCTYGTPDSVPFLVACFPSFRNVCTNAPFFFLPVHRVMITENPSTQAAQEPDTPQTL